MLMDEPFGAIDPITRERLQDEFLNLQAKIRKTVVLVTHDFAEAVKLGDRIAILAEQARVAQYDTPAAILAKPADEFVASFVGAGAAIRRLRFELVGSIDLEPVEVIRAGTRTTPDLRVSTAPGRAVLVDDTGKVLRWLHPADGTAVATAEDHIAVVRTNQSLYDALEAMLRARQDSVAVVDEHGHPVGALSWSALVRDGSAGPARTTALPEPAHPTEGP
jgi:osmoprotectant transport system ATP-binding protein